MLNPDNKVTTVLRHADYMESLDPNEYNQEQLEHCICGHFSYANGRDQISTQFAVDSLGLKYEEARVLFAAIVLVPKRPFLGLFSRWGPPSPKDAAKCLREFATTGVIPTWWQTPYVVHV